MDKQISIWIDDEGNVCLAVPGEKEEYSIFLTPQEAILIGNDLHDLGHSRLSGEQDRAPWMRIPMQYLVLQVEASTRVDPEEVIQDAWVNCWIRDQSMENALLLAKGHVAEFGWKVVREVSQRGVSRDDFAHDPESIHYFDQALIDEIVLVLDGAPPKE